MNITQVTGCNCCPFCEKETGQGGGPNYCTAPGSPEGYDSVLKDNLVKFITNGQEWTRVDGLITPDWCPLPVTIERKNE